MFVGYKAPCTRRHSASTIAWPTGRAVGWRCNAARERRFRQRACWPSATAIGHSVMSSPTCGVSAATGTLRQSTSVPGSDSITVARRLIGLSNWCRRAADCMAWCLCGAVDAERTRRDAPGHAVQLCRVSAARMSTSTTVSSHHSRPETQSALYSLQHDGRAPQAQRGRCDIGQ